jgi:hypothetical protein
MSLEIRLKKDGSIICTAEVTASFLKRALGLMFRKELEKDRGLLIRFSPLLKSRAAIHSFFMRFPIDLIFFDERLCVVELATLKPWQFYTPKAVSSGVIEVNASTISEKNIEVGDELIFREL